MCLNNAADEIRLAPAGRTVLQGTSVQFNCTTFGSYPEWLINGSELDSSVHTGRGIMRCMHVQVSGQLFNSSLCVEANGSNNNTRIQCQVFDSISQPAILRIQGRAMYSLSEANVIWYKYSCMIIEGCFLLASCISIGHLSVSMSLGMRLCLMD